MVRLVCSENDRVSSAIEAGSAREARGVWGTREVVMVNDPG
jgi:hypothetical protein